MPILWVFCKYQKVHFSPNIEYITMSTTNTEVFVVENHEEDQVHLVIKESLLESFGTFECLGSFELAEEGVNPRWGYSVESNSELGRAISSLGLDPNYFRRRTLDETPSYQCLNNVRRVLGVLGSETTPNNKFTFM